MTLDLTGPQCYLLVGCPTALTNRFSQVKQKPIRVSIDSELLRNVLLAYLNQYENVSAIIKC